ncbi:histone PARylation factor 1-like [Macrobrachium nipponense]|uniref:histone PARylation factor 1-like n=1 Tax=Macrobrachium nipponense TaxID=159736 RepID=UPI0030C819C0
MASAFEDDTRMACMYGDKCYRKNRVHLQTFKHPDKRKWSDSDTDEEEEEEQMKSENKRLCTTSPSKTKDDFLIPESIANDVALIMSQSYKIEEDDEDRPLEPSPEVVHEDYPVKESPEDVRLSIEQKFLLEMPDDFYNLWDLCVKLNKDKPEEALIKAGLTLVGPYDVLTGKLKNIKERKVSTYLCHWRYYYDPPEFMTVIAGSDNEFHIGYYRDDPFLLPNFVASMSNVKPGVVTPLGENIFAGVCAYLTQRMKEENPFKKTALQRLYKEVESYAKLKKLSLELRTPAMKERKKRVVAKTFNSAGIVVYVDETGVGYRPLPESDATLRKILQRVTDAKTDEERLKHYDDLQEIITNVQFATDEGDYGMGLELGLDLFAFGGEVFHKSIFHLLSVAYELLSREPYIDIIQAHLKNRRRGSNLSILEVVDG